MSPINWHSFFFLIFALLACGFAVALVLTSNVVRMALYLIFCLGATAGLFFLAGADFVGSMQLMIYVGGTVVLLVFGVMLTAQGPFVAMKTRGGDWIVAVLLSGCLLAVLIPSAFGVPGWNVPGKPELAADDSPNQQTAARLGMGLLGVRVDKLEAEVPEKLKPGMTGYLLPFEIISMHLLVVLVGAAYLARAKRRAGSRDG